MKIYETIAFGDFCCTQIVFFIFFIGNYYDFELLCVEQELDHEVCDPILVYYLHDVNLIKLKISGVLEIIF